VKNTLTWNTIYSSQTGEKWDDVRSTVGKALSELGHTSSNADGVGEEDLAQWELFWERQLRRIPAATGICDSVSGSETVAAEHTHRQALVEQLQDQAKTKGHISNVSDNEAPVTGGFATKDTLDAVPAAQDEIYESRIRLEESEHINCATTADSTANCELGATVQVEGESEGSCEVLDETSLEELQAQWEAKAEELRVTGAFEQRIFVLETLPGHIGGMLRRVNSTL